MISTYFDKERKVLFPAMTFPTITTAGPADVASIRDALADVLQSVVSHEESKAGVESDSLFILTEMINTLTTDLEKEQKGGASC